MSLTRHPKYPNVWQARIYVDGRKKDPKTGKPSNKREPFYFEGTEAAARDWYASLLRGTTTTKAPPLAPTLDQAWADFCLYYKNASSENHYKDFLIVWARHLGPYFGKLRPGQLVPGMIEAYKSKRLAATYVPGRHGQLPADDTPEDTAKRKPISKRTIQKELNYLKAMLTWMTKPEQNMAKPLTFKIKNFSDKQVTPPPKSVPDRRAVITFLRALAGKHDRIYRSIFAVIYYGGMRKQEALQLQGDQVNLAAGYIYIKGKGDKVRTIPIHGKMAVWVRARKRKGYLWLNPDTGKPFDDIKKAVKRGARKSGYPEDLLHPHILRDAFGVHALQSGISLRALQLAYGHASIKTTERYLTLTPQHLADEFNMFGRKRSGAMHQTKTAKSKQ